MNIYLEEIEFILHQDKKNKRIELQPYKIRENVLTISGKEIVTFNRGPSRKTDLGNIFKIEVIMLIKQRTRISMYSTEKSPTILQFAEILWGKIYSKFVDLSSDRIEKEKLHEKYKQLTVLDEIFRIDPDSLEDILKDFILDVDVEYLKKYSLQVKREPYRNKKVFFWIKLGYFLNAGFIGKVEIQPLNDIESRVIARYGGVPYSKDEREKIYHQSGILFNKLADHLKKLYDRDTESSFPKMPGNQAGREEWFRYRYESEKVGIKIPHKTIAEALGYAEGYARTLYSKWMNDNGLKNP